MHNKELFSELKEISKKLHKLQMQLWRETEIRKLELKDRLEKNLTGDDAIKHYNEWMKKEHLEHLMIEI